MSRNELNSFYQNAKREVQRAISNAQMYDEKLDIYFEEICSRMNQNPRSQTSKQHFKSAVKQFNLISEFFVDINLELKGTPYPGSDEEISKNISILELECSEKIPALLPKEDFEALPSNNSSPVTDVDSFGKNSKFLNNEKPLTPPETPKSHADVTRKMPLRRPKEIADAAGETTVPLKKQILYSPIDTSKFSTNYKFKGYITHIQVSSICLVFVCEVTSANFKVIYSLTDEFEKNPMKFNKLTELPGENIVFGILLEGVFSRAIRQSTPSCEQVFLVDTGEILPYSSDFELYDLSDDFKRYPGLAFVAQIVSFKGSTEFDFDDVFSNYECCSFDFVVVSDKDDLICLNIEGFKLVVTEAQKEILLEEPLNTSNAMKAVVGYDPKDDKNLCKFTNPTTGSCFKGANCKKIHLRQLEGGWTRDTDAIDAIDIPNQLELPAIGATVKVIPVYIADAHMIYCHFIRDQQQEDIKFLEAHLNNPEEEKTLISYKFPTSLPCAHELVLAKYSDSKWYRARVIEANVEDGIYKVFFVDYGNSWSVSLQDLRKWSTKFGYLPFQAVCVFLFGLKPIPEKRAEAIDYLDAIIFDTVFNGVVKNNTNELTLDLYDLEGNNVIDDYLKTGFVMEKNSNFVFDKDNIPG